MDNPEPRSQYLNVVLRQIERTSLRIPQFQRHFVWGEGDVLELLGSIVKGYPIGSILTWKVQTSDEYFSGFRTEPFPPAEPGVAAYEVILDGAQRLSSLYGSLRSPGENGVYQVYFDAEKRIFTHLDKKSTPPKHFVPMNAIFDSRAFLAVQSSLAELPSGEKLLANALDLYSTFQDYQIPIIALANAQLDEVVEVFRRVNSSGTPLSPVDFVRALTWQSSFDLEETFQTLSERYQGGPLENLTEEFLVKCLSITADLSVDSRDVIQLRELSRKTNGLRSEVVRMTAALDETANFLWSLRVQSAREVPYEVQRLIIFATKLYRPDTPNEDLRAWFWESTFAEEHQSKPESYTSKLIKEMRDTEHSHGAFEIKKRVEQDILATRPRRRNSAISLGFDLLLRNSDARSLISGEPIDPADGYHAPLFSRTELLDDGADSDQSTAVLANLVALSPEDAKMWRSQRASIGLEGLFKLCQERTGDAESIWASQFVDSRPESPTRGLRRRSTNLIARALADSTATKPI
ncbi:DUF262 domain-containing protein [Pseudoclavibacter sp. AY1H1]|uniref:DUF262 domain-containing protein n=1 Tax=Pseudoclavibacter sp. AY1H1 TaxID=2080584 RepID=UPI000CE8CF7C|nr:DUF262 domain-containing protein [Pseudoclavibacter sp. AY1H1]PPF33358.1 hypothetical protein C5E05_17565 [Pseudoclavibacter sp. AY1H1]